MIDPGFGPEPFTVSVDVNVPPEYLAIIAYRLGYRKGRGGEAREIDVDGIAMDYIQARQRFLVAGTDTELSEWLRTEAGIELDEPEDSEDAESEDNDEGDDAE